MPTIDISASVAQLQQQLAESDNFTEQDRIALEGLYLHLRILLCSPEQLVPGSADNLNETMVILEQRHPAVAGTLRDVVNSLSNMGI